MAGRFRSASPALALTLLLGSPCATSPDGDGRFEQASALKPEHWHRDALDCERERGDCVDWFHFQVPGRGRVQADLALVSPASDTPPFALHLADSQGRRLAEARSEGRTRLRLRHPRRGGVNPGRYSLAVRIDAPDGAIDYELRVSHLPGTSAPEAATPEPPPPIYRTVRAVLLEVETSADGSEAVLLDRGSRSGLVSGQRGRLLLHGRVIAEIVIQDVYPDGSRARVRGALDAPPNPSTVAEIDVPR